MLLFKSQPYLSHYFLAHRTFNHILICLLPDLHRKHRQEYSGWEPTVDTIHRLVHPTVPVVISRRQRLFADGSPRMCVYVVVSSHEKTCINDIKRDSPFLTYHLYIKLCWRNTKKMRYEHLNKYTVVKFEHDVKLLSKENAVKIIMFKLKWRSENIYSKNSY